MISPTDHIHTPLATRVFAGVLVFLTMLLAGVGPASAHLDLVSTSPTDGANLTEPVKKITLMFTVPGEPAGQGIVLLDQAGDQLPAQVSTPDDGKTWVLMPEQDLASGRYGVKWRVAAADTHPKTGSFQFSLTLPTATDSAVDSPSAVPVPTDSDQLDEALAASDTSAAKFVRWLAVAVALTGTLLAIGGLMFLQLVMAGRRSELGRVATITRVSAVLAIVGTLVQVWARSSMRQDGDWTAALNPTALGDLLAGGYGWSIALRLSGAVLVAVGTWLAFRPAPRAAQSRQGDEPYLTASLARSPLALLGAALILASFLFDGHTATTEPRWLVAFSDLTHVLTAATWMAGIVMLAVVLSQRKRAQQPLDGTYLAVRFSTVAAVSLALAGLAGLALTVQILQHPSQLWTTTWGQILIAKVSLVAIVAAIGAYNHYKLIPLLERIQSPTEPPAIGVGNGGLAQATEHKSSPALAEGTSRRLLHTAWLEAVLLIAVVALTAWLINSSTIT